MRDEGFWGRSEAERELPRRRAETARLRRLTEFRFEIDERMPRGMAAVVSPQNDEGERQVVVIQNLSFDSQGRMHKLTQGQLRRWWRAKRGWRHYVGWHTFE